MPAARLTFLYPHLFRSLRAAEPLILRPRTATSQCRRAFIAETPRSMQRHGTAVEPVPLVDPESGLPAKPAAEPDSKTKEPPASPTKEEKQTRKDDGPDSTSPPSPPPNAPEPEKTPSAEPDPGAKPEAKKAGPMEEVMNMGPQETVAQSSSGAEEEAAAAHRPARYVHRFDSYELVNRLTEAGFSKEQSITVMKALRGILSEKVESAQDTLVSRSDVDNETYLFKAACSELSTEVRNNRRAADEETRDQRMRLQHEVDILGQSLNQEVLTLNDTVRGLFNDRKMAVREEQKSNESSIQQINYKISTTLSSDAKSEIEGLRWVLIRRSAIGIAFMAVVVLAALRYAAYVKQQHKAETEREKRAAEERRRVDGKRDHSPSPAAAEMLAAS